MLQETLFARAQAEQYLHHIIYWQQDSSLLSCKGTRQCYLWQLNTLTNGVVQMQHTLAACPQHVFDANHTSQIHLSSNKPGPWHPALGHWHTLLLNSSTCTLTNTCHEAA
jgi:hypothetical protein